MERWLESLSIRAKLFVSHGVQALLLVIGCAAFLYAQSRVTEARAWTQHTREVIADISHLRLGALEHLSSVRSHILTGDDRFRQRYDEARGRFDSTLARVRQQTLDNPAQQLRLEEVDREMGAWRAVIDTLGWERVLERMSEDAAAVSSGAGYQLMEEIRERLDQAEEHEVRLLVDRDAELVEMVQIMRGVTLALLVLGVLIGWRAVQGMQRLIGSPLSALATLVPRLSAGERGASVPHRDRRDEVGTMAAALERLRVSSLAQIDRDWVRAQAAELSSALQETESEVEFAGLLIRRLCVSLDAGYGLAYRWRDARGVLEPCAAYGLPDRAAMQRSFSEGESLVGQCLVEQRLIELNPVPAGYLQVGSGLGSASAHALWFVPLRARGETVAVLELALTQAPVARSRELLEQVMSPSALAWQALARSIRTVELLAESQAQSEELRASEEALRAQQEQLRAANEALRGHTLQLEQQGQRLRASEEELRAQAEELRVTNTALEERGEALRLRQDELERARTELERKASDLDEASRYKSEFLANMSHELRTPLNSMLILSRMLADNAEGNLDSEQVEAARIVHESGKSLLTLINDILDLSKVEAGKMQLHLEDLDLGACLDALERRFRPVAEERRLGFRIVRAPDVPARIQTDGARLTQVLTNLLSNAFKFTHQGEVELALSMDAAGVRFSVRDTGIGIAREKLDKVFQAFEQADSGTSRRYGGTGLGLSIVRGLVGLLAGEVAVESQVGEGTRFHVRLPMVHTGEGKGSGSAPIIAAPVPPVPEAVSPAPVPTTAELSPSGCEPLSDEAPALLIVEDDAAFARVLADIAGKRGLPALTAGSGGEAIRIAQRRPLLGVLLDLGLPDMSGWEVLGRLKNDPRTRSVPVHIISAADDASKGLAMGAVGFLVKPVTREAVIGALDRVAHFERGRRRRLLLVDDDAGSRVAVRHLLEHEDADIIEAADAAAGLAELEKGGIDCVILDLGLPDISGFEFLDRAATRADMPPVVIYSGRDLTPEENLRLRAHTESIVIKGARSPERLLDEVTLFLHAIRKLERGATVAASAPRAAPHEPVSDVAGKTVLVVDDDMRNVFALSKALRARGLNVLMAQDGHKAIAQLDGQTPIDLVLMDIMMPGMDGYETMRRVRARPEWRELPIIAVTAKAMKGDREKCIEAGANDYCSKPIDVDQLMTLIRVWV